MSTNSVKDLEKMTMAQLKEALSKKNLPTDGKKAILVERLAESIRKAEEDAILDPTVDSDVLPSDDILNSAADVLGDISSDIKTGMEQSDADNTGKEKNKIQAPAEETKDERVKRAQRLGLPIGNLDMTSDEAKKRRAERFGIVSGDADNVKAKRAERFGVVNSNIDNDAKEKLLKRAQRFGIPVNSDGKTSSAGTVDSSMLAKRAARFGSDNNNSKIEAAKQARLERFAK